MNRWILPGLLLLGWFLQPVLAQQEEDEAPPQADEVERGLERRPGLEPSRPELPTYVEEADEVPLLLPPVDSLNLPRESLSGVPAVGLQRVQLADSTVLSAEEVARVAATYLDREVTAEELQALRFELTRLYVDQGYITSGVLLPDQRVQNGVVRFDAVEGVLEEVVVQTSGRLRNDYVVQRLKAPVDGPLNVSDIQEQLRQLHQDPLIRRLNSQLVPGSERGRARLLVDVTEARPYFGEIHLSNDRAPSVGSEWAELNFTHRNLLGFGDRLYLRYGYADGLDDWSVVYGYPLNGRGMTLGVTVEQSDSQVVEEPFERIDIRSDNENFAIDLVVPWYRAPHRSLTFTASFENRRSETSLLGIPFSFSPGVQNGVSEVSVARLTADWVDRRPDQVWAIRGRLSYGLDALDATINPGILPDSEFTSLLVQGQWARRFGDNENQLILRGDFQKALDGLLPMEKFSIGGLESVRGYRQNLMVRDNGWLASAEFRMPAFHDELGNSNFQWAFFADIGRGWNEDFDTPQPKSIASAGIGVLWQPLKNLNTELYLAAPFDDVDFVDEDLQDEGVHFRLSYRFF